MDFIEEEEDLMLLLFLFLFAESVNEIIDFGTQMIATISLLHIILTLHPFLEFELEVELFNDDDDDLVLTVLSEISFFFFFVEFAAVADDDFIGPPPPSFLFEDLADDEDEDEALGILMNLHLGTYCLFSQRKKQGLGYQTLRQLLCRMFFLNNGCSLEESILPSFLLDKRNIIMKRVWFLVRVFRLQTGPLKTSYKTPRK